MDGRNIPEKTVFYPMQDKTPKPKKPAKADEPLHVKDMSSEKTSKNQQIRLPTRQRKTGKAPRC
jgi:hypothetical protein